jgi:carboxymethylenebutenolidase
MTESGMQRPLNALTEGVQGLGWAQEDVMAAISIPTSAGEVPGHLAIPVTPGPWPAVVVVHQIYGLDDDIRHIADKFASDGYLAFAPDFLATGNKLGCLVKLAQSLSSGEGDHVQQLIGIRQWLADRADCTGKVGITGFCLGGAFAIVMANKGFDAAAPNYGQLPKHLNAALEGACPVVASYGGLDRSLTGAAAKLKNALQEAGVEHDVKEYPQSGHSFMNQSPSPAWMKPVQKLAGLNVGYVDTDADHAWERILAMFETALR